MQIIAIYKIFPFAQKKMSVNETYSRSTYYKMPSAIGELLNTTSYIFLQ